SNRCFTPPGCDGQQELLVRCSASVQHRAVSPAIRSGLRSAQGEPPLPCAASSPGIRAAYAALIPLPWHAPSRGSGEASRGKLSYRPCRDAGCIKHSPFVDGGLYGRGPARPDWPTPPIRFVSLVPHVRSPLPSDPTSR